MSPYLECLIHDNAVEAMKSFGMAEYMRGVSSTLNIAIGVLHSIENDEAFISNRTVIERHIKDAKLDLSDFYMDRQR